MNSYHVAPAGLNAQGSKDHCSKRCYPAAAPRPAGMLANGVGGEEAEMKPVCVPCQRFFRIKKNDFWFIEGMPIGDSDEALPGNQAPDRWKAYKLWAADRYECEGCGAVILSGFAQLPMAEHWQPDFWAKVRHYGATLQVNDC